MIWTATVVANVGTWMYNAASGWLMTSLNPDPLIVALVQVATTLPIFLLALPAGHWADRFDRRKIVMASQLGACLFSLGLALTSHMNEGGSRSAAPPFAISTPE